MSYSANAAPAPTEEAKRKNAETRRRNAEARLYTPMQAIALKCKDCIHDPVGGSGNWRQQVSACAIEGCPLWTLRPRSRSRL